MGKLDANSTLKRLRNRYRLVVMNEDTYEEVVKFRLSRLSVYIVLSSVFVLLTVLTVALIVFTPIKYYLPGVGYGDARQVREFRQLKIRTDSMENALKYKQQYFDDIKKVIQGKVPVMDTNKLELPKADNTNE
jgi:Sec-independent protein translocase protein TatA